MLKPHLLGTFGGKKFSGLFANLYKGTHGPMEERRRGADWTRKMGGEGED
jgi:hypothetical protein